MKKLQWAIHSKDPNMQKYKLDFESKKKELDKLSKDLKEEYNKDPWSRSGSWGRDHYWPSSGIWNAKPKGTITSKSPIGVSRRTREEWKDIEASKNLNDQL